MLVVGKKCWVGSVKKWLLKNQPQEVVGFLPLVQLACSLQAGIAQLPLGMVHGTTHVHSIRLVRVKGWAESRVLWCNMHNVRVGARMAELAALRLMQPVGIRFAVRGLTNQEARAPPPPSFPHTMLSVERVKDNMWLVFIKKFFTNHAIGTNVQTRYLRFKVMSYESEN
jgi:hypothetical protein